MFRIKSLLKLSVCIALIPALVHGQHLPVNVGEQLLKLVSSTDNTEKRAFWDQMDRQRIQEEIEARGVMTVTIARVALIPQADEGAFNTFFNDPLNRQPTQVAKLKTDKKVAPETTPDRDNYNVDVESEVLAKPNTTNPQTPIPPPPDVYQLHNLEYWKGFLADTKAVATAPLRWDKKDWITATLVIAGTGAVMLLDRPIQEWSQNNQNNITNFLAPIGNALGNGMYVLPAVAGAYVLGEVIKNEKLRKVALLSIESVAITGALTAITKQLAGRHRPNAGDGPQAWDGPMSPDKNYSFFSGHTSFAFAIASTVSEVYKDDGVVIPIVAYSLATLVGLSRIHDDAHWASDVALGAAVGYFIGKFIAKRHAEGKWKNWNINVSTGHESYGFGISRAF